MTDSNEEEWQDMYLDDVGVDKRWEQRTPSRLADACLVALWSQAPPLPRRPVHRYLHRQLFKITEECAVHMLTLS